MLRCSKSSLVEKMVLEKVEKQDMDIVFAINMEKLYAIRYEFVYSYKKPFCELLNVKLFKRHNPTPPEVLCKKGVRKSFAKFTGKHLRWSLFIF